MEMTFKKILNKLNNNETMKILIAFIVSMVMIALYLDKATLLNGGDATDIWKTITTYRSDNMYLSYVMYKGVASVYPYVWLYEFSTFLSLSPFFFIKVYHCLLFSYVVALGLPKIYMLLFNKKVSLLKLLVFVVACFFITKFTGALEYLYIDLPSWASFCAMTSLSLQFMKQGFQMPKWKFLVLVFLLGMMLFCFSGQYVIAAICLLLFNLIVFIKNFIQNKKTKLFLKLLALAASIIVFAVPMVANQSFMENVVAKTEKEYNVTIGRGDFWIKRGLTLFNIYYRLFSGSTPMSTRGYAVLADENGVEYANSIWPSSDNRDEPLYMEYKEVIKMWAKHPADMLSIWLNKLFLAFSPPGPGKDVLLYLFVFYSMLYAAFLTIARKIKTIKDLFSLNTLIFLAVMSTVLIPCALTIEYRYCITVWSFVLAIAILGDTMWHAVKRSFCTVLSIFNRKSDVRFVDVKLKYSVVLYVAFVIACILHYGTLMELSGIDAYQYILFK